MIRVLNMIINGLNLGGIQTSVMNYYRNIDHEKIQFDFLIPEGRQGKYYEAEALALGARIYTYPWGGIGATKQKTLLWLIKFMRKHPEYKIVHIHCERTKIYVEALLLALSGVPIRIIHSRNSRPGRVVLKRKLHQFLIRIFATNLFAISAEAGVYLFGAKAIDSKKFCILRNARNLEPFKFDPNKRDELRRNFNLEGKLVFINIGRLAVQKNLAFLLDAFALAHGREPNAVLLLAGDGKLRGDLERKADSLGLQDSVQFLGFRSDVAELLLASDVFCFPSLYEGLGTAAIEAQASGLPCLLSDKVPHEAKITDLVEFLPIGTAESPEIWAERMLAYGDFERKDAIEDVRRAGYDIKEAAKKLEDFYINSLK